MRILVLVILCAFSALAALTDDVKPTEVMLVGTFHFANPGLDFIKSDVPDVLTEGRQKEIAEVVSRLRKFRPTKIAVEWPAERNEELNRRYAAYLTGEHQSERGETYQLGFRLAKLQQLPAVHAIDVKGDMDIAAVMAYAQKSDPAFMRAFQTMMREVVGPMMKMQKEAPIGETLRSMNDPALLLRANAMYVEMIRVGDSANPVGADQVGIWYVRNIKIFANLARIAEPGDRIVVLYGQGHVPLLQQLVQEMPGMKLVRASDYL
jgi:hypothetical protein